jgi:hypothetical protein
VECPAAQPRPTDRVLSPDNDLVDLIVRLEEKTTQLDREGDTSMAALLKDAVRRVQQDRDNLNGLWPSMTMFGSRTRLSLRAPLREPRFEKSRFETLARRNPRLHSTGKDIPGQSFSNHVIATNFARSKTCARTRPAYTDISLRTGGRY